MDVDVLPMGLEGRPLAGNHCRFFVFYHNKGIGARNGNLGGGMVEFAVGHMVGKPGDGCVDGGRDGLIAPCRGQFA